MESESDLRSWPYDWARVGVARGSGEAVRVESWLWSAAVNERSRRREDRVWGDEGDEGSGLVEWDGGDSGGSSMVAPVPV